MRSIIPGYVRLQIGNSRLLPRVAERALKLIFALLLLVATACPAPAAAEILFERSEITIVTGKGPVRFDVELATNDRQRAQGLQHRTAMASDAGMLFLFPAPQIIDMWMKNTPLSLDMIFIRGDGHVVAIAQETKPFSLDIVSSGVPAYAVLEVLAGTARRIGLAPGDRVIHPSLGRQ